MKLVIKSKTPDWWMEDKPDTIVEWWNGLGWQTQYIPEKLTDPYFMCNSPDIAKETICYVDSYTYTIADSFGVDFVYKMIGHTTQAVREGIISEWHNILECFLIMFI